MSDNYAKVKSRKYASDDDAENLLAGILDETEDIAKAEQERIEAELKAKEEEERRKREEEARRKKEAAAAKLSAELERLEKVEQRRTEKLEALKIEELKERGEWIDPEEERRKLEEKLEKEAEMKAMKEAAEQKARARHHVPSEAAGPAAGAMPAPEKSSGGMVALVGIVVALAIGGGGVALAVMTGYEVDGATYSKAVFAPKEQQVALVEKGFTPIPKPEPVVEEDDEKETTTRRRRRRPRRASNSKSKPKAKSKPISGKPSQNKANKKADELENMLDTDIFGGGM